MLSVFVGQPVTIAEVKKYLPALKLDTIEILDSTEDDHAAVVHIKYTITDDIFITADSILIKI